MITSDLSFNEIQAQNDKLATEHSIDDYYARSLWPIRFIERRRLELIRAMVGPESGLDIAEVGSGGGHVLRMFPKARLTAIDVSPVFIETARKNLKGYDVRFLLGETSNLHLANASFDRIICTEVLEHTVHPESVLAEIRRLLKPGGAAVITVPNDPLILQLKGFVRKTPLGLALGNKVSWGGDKYHLHVWTPTEFENLLTPHFRVIEKASAPFESLPIRACFKCVCH